MEPNNAEAIDEHFEMLDQPAICMKSNDEEQ